MTNRANVYIKRGKYSDKIADNKIKRGFFLQNPRFFDNKVRKCYLRTISTGPKSPAGSSSDDFLR